LKDLPIQQFLWSIISFGLGLFLGHWLAVHRDRRKKFNEIADRLYLFFDAEERRPSTLTIIPGTDLTLFQRHLGWLKQWQYKRALKSYEKAQTESRYQDRAGEILYKDTENIKKAAHKLKKFVHRK